MFDSMGRSSFEASISGSAGNLDCHRGKFDLSLTKTDAGMSAETTKTDAGMFAQTIVAIVALGFFRHYYLDLIITMILKFASLTVALEIVNRIKVGDWKLTNL